MKRLAVFLSIIFLTPGAFAQISLSIDELDIGPLIYVRHEIVQDSIVGTILSEYERPAVRVVLHINELNDKDKLDTYSYYGCFTYHGYSIKSFLFLHYYSESASQIILTNPHFFDMTLYQFPKDGIEDYTEDIMEIIPSFTVRVETLDGVLVTESSKPSKIVLTRGTTETE